MGALVGYARVSTDDQRMDLQIDALTKVGCINIYQETVSGVSKRRSELDLCIKELQPGDTLVVWRLDRIARSMVQLYARLEQIQQAGASFKSLTEDFDFSTATGKLLLGLFGLIAEFERELTRERTKAGVAARIARGQKIGAVLKFTPALRSKARKLLAETKRPRHTRRGIAKRLGISYQTLYVWIRDGKP